MIKIYVFLLAILIFQKAVITSYIAPSNTKYPFGDETQFNHDMLDKDANPFPSGEKSSIDKRLGKCPADSENLTIITDPFVPCPDYAVIPPPIDIDSRPNKNINPDVLCKTCDLELTSDGEAVLLECNNCLDVPSPYREADTTARDLQFKVFFVQVANYSDIEITGSEYFNP